MSEVDGLLRVGEISNKYDRIYKARDRESDAIYEVNVARLQCTCPDFMSKRAAFLSNDARRVCAHIYDKLYSTKAERALDPILQLFIRYGRSMFSYRIVRDDFGLLIIGEPFGPGVVRALGVIRDHGVASVDDSAHYWTESMTDGCGLTSGLRQIFGPARFVHWPCPLTLYG